VRITLEEETTAQDILDRIEARYGSQRALERHVNSNPDDVGARMALHDLRDYERRPRDEKVRETRDIVIPDEALDRLTFRRIGVLLALRALGGRVEGLRELARVLERDVKNVSEDLAALEELGLVRLQTTGAGKATVISFPAVRMDLHLVEA
jgi:hypothetical protein